MNAFCICRQLVCHSNADIRKTPNWRQLSVHLPKRAKTCRFLTYASYDLHRQVLTGIFPVSMTEAVPSLTPPLLSSQEQEVYALLLCGGDPHHPSLQTAGRAAAAFQCTDAATVLHRVLSIVADVLRTAGPPTADRDDSSSDGDATDEEFEGDRPVYHTAPHAMRSSRQSTPHPPPASSRFSDFRPPPFRRR